MAGTKDRLPQSFLDSIEAAHTRFVSHVTAWEIQIKHEKYGPRFEFSLHQLEKVMNEFSCTELPIEYADIRGVKQIQFVHSDPFDRLLMSQAARRGLTLATLDEKIIATQKLSRAFQLLKLD